MFNFSENTRNYVEIVLCHNEKKLRKTCMGQHVSNLKVINENLVAVMKKTGRYQNEETVGGWICNFGIIQTLHVSIVRQI